MAELAAASIGREGSIRSAPTSLLRALGVFVKPVGEMVEMLYEFDSDFVVDSSAFTEHFGMTATPLDAGAGRRHARRGGGGMSAGDLHAGVRGGVVDRFRSPSRWLLGLGPVALAALFLLRATTPVVDPTLLGIFVVLLAGVAGLVAGSRIGAAAVLLLSLALFQPMTAREFSFSLSALDSDAWQIWAAASLVALGWSIVAAVVVLVRGERTDAVRMRQVGVQVAGGLGLGALLIAVFPAMSPQPAFGQDLGNDEITRLPVIEMLDFGYDPVVVEAPAGEIYRARLDNVTDLPHTFTIESIDIEVFVPAGRWAIVELDPDDLAGAPLAVICTIGDHLAHGMAA